MGIKSLKSFQQAFSLVELMVVIAIIGILSAIAVPSYKSYVIKARVAELVTIAESIQSRMVQAYNDGTWIAGSNITTLFPNGAPTSTYANASYATPTAANSTANCIAASPNGGGIAGATAIGTVAVDGNATKIGVTAPIRLISIGCLVNDTIRWACGVSPTTTAGNNLYFPANCQITFALP